MIKLVIFSFLFLMGFSAYASLDFRLEFIKAKKGVSSLPPYSLKLHGTKLEAKLLTCLKQGHRVLKGGKLSHGSRLFKSFGSMLQASNYGDSSYIYDFYPDKESMELLGKSDNDKIIEALRVDDQGDFLIEESLRSLSDLNEMPLLISPIYTLEEALDHLKKLSLKTQIYTPEQERPWVLSYSKCKLEL